MALAIDGSTPAIVTQTVNTVAALTTGSFTPPAGAVLLVLWAGDALTEPAGTPTITDNLGTPLTYTQTDWKHRADASPTVFGQASAWTAVVGSSAAMTVTVTSGAVSGDRTAALAVVVITGADTASPAGAHGKSGSASAAAIAQSYTAQATGGQGFIAVCDFDQTGAESAGAGCTLIGSANVSTSMTYTFARRTTADDSNGVANTLNLTLLATSSNLAFVYVEIKPTAAGGSPTWLPTWPSRRRILSAPRPARAHIATPVRAQVNPPFPFNGIHQARQPRGMLSRRGHSAQVVPPQIVVTAPAYPPLGVRPRLKGARLFRDRAVAPPPAQAVPPTSLRTRIRGLRIFRSNVAFPVPVQVILTPPAYPPPSVRTRVKGLRLFRARTATPVPPQVVLAPPAYVPQSVRTRIRGIRLFRGRAAAPVPAQLAVAPSVYIPQAVRARLKFPAVRRHDIAPPLVEQVPPAQLDPRPRLKLRPARSRIVGPPQPQAEPPLTTRLKLRLARIFRGAARPVVPAQVIVIPPARVAQATRARRNQFAARRHRGGVDGWMVPGVHICTTTRPSGGTTSRSGSGTTAYNTATTARTSAGITPRPNSGTTTDPC